MTQPDLTQIQYRTRTQYSDSSKSKSKTILIQIPQRVSLLQATILPSLLYTYSCCMNVLASDSIPLAILLDYMLIFLHAFNSISIYQRNHIYYLFYLALIPVYVVDILFSGLLGINYVGFFNYHLALPSILCFPGFRAVHFIEANVLYHSAFTSGISKFYQGKKDVPMLHHWYHWFGVGYNLSWP